MSSYFYRPIKADNIKSKLRLNELIEDGAIRDGLIGLNNDFSYSEIIESVFIWLGHNDKGCLMF